MPISPNVVESAAIRLKFVPGVVLDFLGAQAFRAVCVAVELELFEALAGEALTAQEAARRIHASERGVNVLLEALDALGYVKKKGNRFATTPMTDKWLLRRSSRSLDGGIPFFQSMVFERWGHLAGSIRRGEPVMHGDEWLRLHPAGWSWYEEAMLAVARSTAAEIVARTKLSRTARRLLDLGGGHGFYAIEFCRHYRNLSATILDLAPALQVAQKIIASENMAARVSTMEGDLFADDFGADYDVVLLFNVIHAFRPDQNAELLRKIAGALNERGVIVLLEQTDDSAWGAMGKALARLQALNFFNDLGGQVFTSDQICGWLAGAGFSDHKSHRLRSMPGFTLISSTKRRIS